jgi:uncharacterized membrane protein
VTVREDDEDRGRDMSRLLALSDGVFAFALTLLVVNLSASPNQPLGVDLHNLGDRAWAAALSFAIIGRFWLIHRRMFARIRRSDEALARLNLAFLAAIVTMPFSAQLLAHPGRQPIQVIAYATTTGVAALLKTSLWGYAWIKDLLVKPRPGAFRGRPEAVAAGLTDLVTALLCLISVAVAPFSPFAGELIWVAFLIPNRCIIPWLRPVARRVLTISGRLGES